MAKQVGIHQIRGKVGEHSYYSQTGVSAGLIRAINQAMPDRVKNDAAYANTRLNNAEFGQACKIAAAIAQYIVPKYRPMILPFSQAYLVKAVLEQIKLGGGDWGERNLYDPKGEVLAPILSSVAKNNFDDWGVTLVWNSQTSEYDLVASSQFDEKLAAIGAEGVVFKIAWADTWIGEFEDGKYFSTYPRANFSTVDMDESGSEGVAQDYRPAPQPGAPVTQNKMIVVIALPYRLVAGNTYTLQEHCTFKAFQDDHIS